MLERCKAQGTTEIAIGAKGCLEACIMYAWLRFDILFENIHNSVGKSLPHMSAYLLHGLSFRRFRLQSLWLFVVLQKHDRSLSEKDESLRNVCETGIIFLLLLKVRFQFI